MSDLIIIEKALGYAGKLLSGSKSMYRDIYPDNKVYFNACLFNNNFKQIWFGDIDFEFDTKILQQLANDLKETIYATPEQPYRWDGLKKEQLNNEEIIKFESKVKNE